MPKALVIALAGLAALTTAHAPTALGQGGLDRRLAAATRIECTFSTLATGTWDKNVPAIAVTPAEIEANFFDINVEEGTAEAESEYGASFISVRGPQPIASASMTCKTPGSERVWRATPPA